MQCSIKFLNQRDYYIFSYIHVCAIVSDKEIYSMKKVIVYQEIVWYTIIVKITLGKGEILFVVIRYKNLLTYSYIGCIMIVLGEKGMEKILVVEDDYKTNEAVVEYLNSLGYQTLGVHDGEQAYQFIKEKSCDLIILDIMLPKISGVMLLGKIREFTDVPVLMLTAISDESMQVLSFDGDADDYMTKPFSMLVLGRIVHALLKRSRRNEKKSNILQLENAMIDFDACQSRVNGEPCELTVKEYELLRLFAENRGIVLTREKMVEAIWGCDADILDRTIDTYVKNIRKKLQLTCITTIKGLGYRLETE